MTQKTLLIVSAVLTAFVLVVGGAIAARVSQPPAPVEAAPAQAVQAAPAPTTADLNAQVEQLVQQREAQYRQLIEEANQRLTQANGHIATSAQSQSAAPAAFAAQPLIITHEKKDHKTGSQADRNRNNAFGALQYTKGLERKMVTVYYEEESHYSSPVAVKIVIYE